VELRKEEEEEEEDVVSQNNVKRDLALRGTKGADETAKNFVSCIHNHFTASIHVHRSRDSSVV
jgi:hypothetical protein